MWCLLFYVHFWCLTPFVDILLICPRWVDSRLGYMARLKSFGHFFYIFGPFFISFVPLFISFVPFFISFVPLFISFVPFFETFGQSDNIWK
jgi:hypothetical protein